MATGAFPAIAPPGTPYAIPAQAGNARRWTVRRLVGAD